jgi:hypothetical protein
MYPSHSAKSEDSRFSQILPIVYAEGLLFTREFLPEIIRLSIIPEVAQYHKLELTSSNPHPTVNLQKTSGEKVISYDELDGL